MPGGWGFIIRDHEGEGVLAGAGRLESVMAETLGCRMSLTAAPDHGISHFQLETDSTNLQEALKSTSFDLATGGMLFHDLRALLHEQLVCSSILYVPRSCNLLAHALASLALSWDLGSGHCLGVPSPNWWLAILRSLQK